MNIKLSICIPTYNRAERCLNMLKSIVDHADVYKLKKDGVISIIVSNNCSTTDYSKVKQFCQEYEISYNVQEKNVGLVNNFIFCLTEAASDYVWVIGDDDYINFELVNEAIGTIETDQPNIILINHSAIDREGNIIIENMYGNYDNTIDIEKIVENNGGLMFISANIYNREYILKYINDCKRMLALPFYLSLCCIASSRIGYLKQTYIKNVWGSTSWEKFAAIVLVLQKLWFSLKVNKNIENTIINKIVKYLISKQLKYFAYASLKNLYYRYFLKEHNETFSIRDLAIFYFYVYREIRIEKSK